MQIAYAINQVLNHRAASLDVIMRLLEKITHEQLSRRLRERENNDIVDNFVERHAINRGIIALINFDVKGYTREKI